MIARGRTAAETTFVVSRERQLGFGPTGCRAELSVEYKYSERSGSFTLTGSGGGPICIAGRSAQRAPLLECGSGALTIEAVLPATVRTVRLKLADGRTIASRAVAVPARYGGPAALYVQALSARSSVPVSITELDSGGATIATVPIPRHARCPTRAEEEPRSATLAEGTAPGGAKFTIGGVYFNGSGHGSFNLELSSAEGSESQFSAETGPPRKTPFEPSFGGGCPPAGWAIAYGVLKPPGASVEAVTASGEEALRLVAIPKRLHAGGILAYGAFATTPERLIVRDASGKTIATEDLSGQAAYHREYCEGYAEPSS